MNQRKRAGAVVAVALAAVALWLAWMFWPRPGPTATKAVVVKAEEAAPTVPVTKKAAAPAQLADAGPGGRRAGDDPSIIARLGWGSGPNQLGHDLPEEGNAEGPMSLTVDRSGRVLVLDNVNGRVVLLNERGEPEKTVPVTVRAPQELQATDDGKLVVLDRLADRSVAIMGPDGALLGELPLEGPGIDEAGGVTGLFVDGDDVYAEREHGPLVRLGDTSGKPDAERPEIPGRPSRDGKLYLNAGLIDPLAGRVYVNAIERASLNHLYTREYKLSVPLIGILALDTDLAGVIYLALLAQLPRSSPDEEPKHVVRLLCIDPKEGAPLGQTELPATDRPEESFRDFAVQDTGGVVYAFRNAEGVVYQRADCR